MRRFHHEDSGHVPAAGHFKEADIMEKRGIIVKTDSLSGLAEEAGAAYKDIDDVIEAIDLAGISKKVVRFMPIANIKG